MNDLRGYLTAPQVWQVINAAPSARDRLLVMTMFMSGRRVSEIVGYKKQFLEAGKWRNSENIIGGLKPKDILPDRNAIVFTILKKGDPIERIISVPFKLKEALLTYIKSKGIEENDLVFPITRQRVFRIVRRMGAKAGITRIGDKGLHPHHFRHSFAVFMVDKINIKKLQELLCHSDVSTTTVYLQYASKDIEKDVEEAWK